MRFRVALFVGVLVSASCVAVAPDSDRAMSASMVQLGAPDVARVDAQARQSSLMNVAAGDIPAPAVDPDGGIYGFADTHTHQFSTLGFGGL